MRVSLAIAMAAALSCIVAFILPAGAGATTLPAGFDQTAVLPGVAKPQDIAIAPTGRVFVAEKSGLIRTFDSIDDTTPTLFADLRTKVHNYGARGLLSIVVDPGFPAKPYVYVYYTLDAPIGGTPPVYGGTSSFDSCAKATGGLDENCIVGSRISRLTVSGETMSAEQILVEDYCQQYPAHAAGGLAFGADGNLYAGGGDGSTSAFWDYGQTGTPANPCGDPGGSSPTPPTSEAGRLRAQDLRTTGDPTGLDGTLIRINPSTGAAASGNPLSGPDANAKRILAYGFRDASRIAVRPGTSDVWVADRGGGYWEEFNRVSSASSVRNFGWPCFEGGLDAGGNPYNRIRPKSEEQNLNICQALYSNTSLVTAPYWGYDHELPVTDDENCEQDGLGSPNGSTLSGATFYPAAGSFPPMYNKALFFADRLRSCIWAMLPDASGVPKRGSVIPFAGLAMRATDLEVTSTGDLLYIDQSSDVVQRIHYTNPEPNQPPTAVATADALSGEAPVTVTFDGTGSTDPNLVDTLTYQWDLDGDGQFDDSVLAKPSFTYNAAGNYTVTLKVTDTAGASSTAVLQVAVRDEFKTLRFTAIADARVEEGNASSNFGTSNKLRTVGGSATDVESYLRFQLAGVTGPVRSAKLIARSLTDATADGPAVHPVTGSWTESGVKWSNRPGTGAAIADVGAIAQNTAVEYDVKSLVTGNGALDLALRSTSNDGVDFASREDTTASKRPVLEVTFVTSDSVAPSVPAGLTAKAVSTDRVDLSWGAASDEWGVTGYEIYRDGQLLDATAATSYPDASVNPATTYKYTVRSVDGAGNRSAPSAIASATTPAVVIPTTPLITTPDLRIGPSAPPAAKSSLTLALVATSTQHVLRQRGVILLASCSAPCTLSATGAVALAGASRTLGLRAISRSAQSGKQVRLRLALSAKTLRAVRRALRRGKKPVARVTVVATDAAGNSAKTTRRINLRR